VTRVVLSFLLVLAGCGAKTGLDAPEPPEGGVPPAPPVAFDASVPVEPPDAFVPAVDAGPPDAGLELLTVALGSIPPTVLWLVDRSGSMREPIRRPTAQFSGDRWGVLQDILTDDGALIDLLFDRAVWGIATYSSRAGACPDVDFIPPGASVDEVQSGLNVLPGGGTPTAEALTEVTERLQELGPFEGTTAIILVTDGEPTGCGVSGTDPLADTVAAARAAHEAGINVYAISVGIDLSLDHLQDVANAGVGITAAELAAGRAPARLYEGDGAFNLSTSFNEVAARLTRCTGTLSEPVAEACDLIVRIGNLEAEPVPCDDPDGFRLLGDRTLQITGESCTLLRSRPQLFVQRVP
jgi:hypothetical protein